MYSIQGVALQPSSVPNGTLVVISEQQIFDENIIQVF